MLREVAEGIAKFIEEDQVLHDDGHVTVVVEDKANVASEIEIAIGQLGVCVLIAVTGFERVDKSPILQGNIHFEISCHESPELNRDDPSVLTAQGVMERLMTILHYRILTAQGVMERLMTILHYRRFPFLYKQMIFKDFTRDDVDEANIVTGNFEAQHILGYEDRYFRPGENETPQN